MKPNDLANPENFVKVSIQSGATTEDMLDYIEPAVREKLDTVIIHGGTNDITNGEKTMNKMKKLNQYIRENNKDKTFKLVFLVSLIEQIEILKRKLMILTAD